MSRMASEPELERDWRALLSPYPAPLRKLAAATRALVASTVPHASQRVRTGWRLLGFSAPNYFACVAPVADHVRIGFEHGVLLEDGAGILEGTGSQMRWIAIRRAADLRRPEVAALIAQAADLRRPRRASPATINAAWHRRHPMPKSATTNQRLAWHVAHQEHCACRPIPVRLQELAEHAEG